MNDIVDSADRKPLPTREQDDRLSSEKQALKEDIERDVFSEFYSVKSILKSKRSNSEEWNAAWNLRHTCPSDELTAAMRSLPVRTADLEQLARDMVADYPEAANTLSSRMIEYRGLCSALAEGHLGLVVDLACRYKKASNRQYSGVSIEDLIQEGNLGLLEAADIYDPRTGYRITTIATIVIKRYLIHCLRSSGLIRRGRSLNGLAREARKAYNSLSHELSRKPTSLEIAKKIGPDVTEEDVDYVYIQSAPIQDVHRGSGLGRSTFQESDRERDNLSRVGWSSRLIISQTADLSSSLASDTIMEPLTQLERQIVRLRLGLNGPKYTLAETAQICGRGVEHTRTIEKTALAKLMDADERSAIAGSREKE